MTFFTLIVEANKYILLQTTFMDIVNDNLIQIMKYLDPLTRRKLRITKSLDKAYLCVKNNMEKIEIDVCLKKIILV